MAHTHPAEVTFFHVQDQGRIQPHLLYRLDEFNRIDRERLEGLEARLNEFGAAKVHMEVEFGRPGPLIVEKIRKGGYSMLVIAGQGRGYMAEAFLGRVEPCGPPVHDPCPRGAWSTSKVEGGYGMCWMCACGRENDDHSNECIECHNLRRREQTEEDLERLLEEELKASRKDHHEVGVTGAFSILGVGHFGP